MTLFLLPNVRAVAFAATFAAMAVGCVREKEPEEQVLQKALLVEPNAIRLRRPGSTSSQKVVCRVTNESGHLVEITDIKGTCACAIAEPPSRSALAHGEFVDVVMEVRFPEFGKQDSTITIATNPPDAGARIPVQLVSPKEPIPRMLLFPAQVQLIPDASGNNCTATAFLTTLERADSDRWLTGGEFDNQAITVSVELVESGDQTTKEKKQRSDAIVRREYKLTFEYKDRGKVAFSTRLLLNAGRSRKQVPWESCQTLVSYTPKAASFHLRPSVVVLSEFPRRDSVTRVSILGPVNSRVELDTAEVPAGIRMVCNPVASGETDICHELEIHFDDVPRDFSHCLARLKCITGSRQEVHALRVRKAW